MSWPRQVREGSAGRRVSVPERPRDAALVGPGEERDGRTVVCLLPLFCHRGDALRGLRRDGRVRRPGVVLRTTLDWTRELDNRFGAAPVPGSTVTAHTVGWRAAKSPVDEPSGPCTGRA